MICRSALRMTMSFYAFKTATLCCLKAGASKGESSEMARIQTLHPQHQLRLLELLGPDSCQTCWIQKPFQQQPKVCMVHLKKFSLKDAGRGPCSTHEGNCRRERIVSGVKEDSARRSAKKAEDGQKARPHWTRFRSNSRRETFGHKRDETGDIKTAGLLLYLAKKPTKEVLDAD